MVELTKEKLLYKVIDSSLIKFIRSLKMVHVKIILTLETKK